SRGPAERCDEAGRIEDADFASGFDERAEQSEERAPTASKPVIDDADLDAFARALCQEVDETAADRIAVNDVHLHVNRGARVANGLLPCRVVLAGIAKNADAVSGDERRARRPAEH